MATRALSDGAHGPQVPRPWDSGRDLISSLPPELFINIFERLRPLGPLTTYESTAARPDIRRNHIESRSTFASLCRVSRSIRLHATRYLYETVLLRDPKELLYFFRTIVDSHDLRLTVCSFSWAGVLSTGGTSLGSSARRDAEMAFLAPGCWASINWPSNPIDLDIARLMGIDGPDTLQSWRVLGAVLAMISKVRSLFMLQGHEPITGTNAAPCPEQSAVEALTRPPDSGRFLQELGTITLEPPHNRKVEFWVTTKSLIALLNNSPSVRRVELKGAISFGFLRYYTQQSLQVVVSEHVKELLHFRAFQPQEDMMDLVATFPKLVRLEVEYGDGSRTQADSDLNVSEALLMLSGTLETLSLTTTPGSSWRFTEVLPPLPALRRMTTLKHLTTESIWLFGRQDPCAAAQLPNLLPRSLVCFRLVDYWGTSLMDDFYPQLPNDWSMLEFYDLVFSKLHEICSTRLPHLEDIVLALHSSGPRATAASGSDGQDLPEYVRAFSLRFQSLFRSVGVRFSIIGPNRVDAELQSSWANMA